MSKKNKKTSQRGFGLVEVLVSVAIISLVIVAFNQLAVYAYYNWENARAKSVAYNLIQSTMEDLRNRRDINVNTEDATWSDMPFLPEGDTVLDPPVTIGGKDFTTTVNVQSMLATNIPGHDFDNTLRKKVTVMVSWKERLGPRSLQAETYLTDWKGKY